MNNFSTQDFSLLVGNAPVFGNAALAGGGVVNSTNQSPPANGDARRLNFACDPGNYVLVWYVLTGTNAGVVDVTLDGVVIHSTDLYNAGGRVEQTVSIPFTVGIGDHVIDFVVNGKNAGSSNYHAYHVWAHIDPV